MAHSISLNSYDANGADIMFTIHLGDIPLLVVRQAIT